eukprot:6456226-Ditylum_brightwellii.AAC.1
MQQQRRVHNQNDNKDAEKEDEEAIVEHSHLTTNLSRASQLYSLSFALHTVLGFSTYTTVFYF